MSIEKSCWRNPPPPNVKYDNEITEIKTKKIYYTFHGEECRIMNILGEDFFKITFEESFSDTTTTDEEVESIGKSDPVLILSPNRVIETEHRPSPIKIKKEKSDSSSEILKPPRKKAKHRSPSKREGRRFVNYSSSSEESGDEYDHRLHRRRTPKEEPEPEEYKPNLNIQSAFGNYYCDICNLNLNSEATLNTHLRGKRHQKEINAQKVAQTALQSLSLKTEEGKAATYRGPSDKNTDVAESLYPRPELGIKRILVDETSLIQDLVDDYRDGPMLGLSQVLEIRPLNKRDVIYYCKLCDAPCATISIMNHLTGYKHRLKCLENINPSMYDKYRYQPKKTIENKVSRYLKEYEKRHRRELIKVETEVLDSQRESQPGPSRCAEEVMERNYLESTGISSVEDLDMSQNDFRCKVCDSHMNNKNMWESHVRGKRHLKNKNKYPGESASKVRAIPCKDETAHLMHQLRDYEDEYFVGLEYIRETQGEKGNMYNCFLCGACTTDFDIIDHLRTDKHRIKYLEAANKKGKPNSIEHINSIQDISKYNKSNLILDECRTDIEKYGYGNIEVYRTKTLFPPGISSRY